MRVADFRAVFTLFAAMIASVALLADPAGAKDAPKGQTFLAAVGVCPPYRTDINVEVCSNAAEAIVETLGEALSVAEDNKFNLTGENATGRNFLRLLSGLRTRMTAQDRLVLYLNAHGDAFWEWEDYYKLSGAAAELSQRFEKRDDYVLVFWTEEEPAVPLLALAEKDWLLVEDVIEALDALPGKVALILDSCASGRSFAGFHRMAKRSQNIDYVAASAGSEQLANIDPSQTLPLFTRELTNAMSMPQVSDFGEAMDYARMTTTLHAAAQCMLTTVPKSDFTGMFPDKTVPNTTAPDGGVLLPMWACSQVPSVADFSGEMSETAIYANSQALTQ